MSKYFDIKLGGPACYSAIGYFQSTDKDICCSAGNGDGQEVGEVEWKSMGVHISGGPEFLRHLRDCGEDVIEIKALCWNYMENCMTLSLLRNMVADARNEGRREGRAEIRNGIKEMLDIQE